MKYTIEGFSQTEAMKFQNTEEINGKMITQYLDCTDLSILRWFVDFYPFMKKINIDGKEFAFVTYQRLADDMPLIRISKRSLADRLMKMTKMGILEHRHVKEMGSFSAYTYGPEYEKLVNTKRKNEEEIEVEPSAKNGGGMQLNTEGYAVEHRTNSNLLYNQLCIYNNISNNIFSAADKTPFGASLNETIKNWIEYKIQKRQSYQERGMKSLITQIMNNVGKYGEDAVEEVIILSMGNNYMGIAWEKIRKHKEKTPVYEETSTPWKAAAWMSRKIHSMHPSLQEQPLDKLQSWASVFDKMESEDGHTPAEMLKVMRFVYENDYWKTKIANPWDLRKNYTKILFQAEQEGWFDK